MSLKALFQKPVDRPIDPVIKADDEASLRHELEEYVLTNEVSKRLDTFFDAYNNYTDANGVWLSGFFGSGKSHLLKMLALVLENRSIDGTPAADLFLPKCGDNTLLRADIEKAVAVPSKSILFNIDQKADVISKTQTDALLAVFVKVFDELCGYYGKQPYIAQFERELDHEGQLDGFKTAFEAASGKAWEWGRARPTRISKHVDTAYNAITGQQLEHVLDKFRTDYHLSIEDFANQVLTYIKAQAPKFRLNFFVDEVGQYISENVKLMTNLQTIAESFNTKCRGRAWIIVTAQEDMDSVVGEVTDKQANDFSKIQARFKNRMKLTSADAAEVIQLRLLAKTGDATAQLTAIYDREFNNFKTLFDFADGSKTYRNFRDAEHFSKSYPFVPYQYDLFQAAIESLSVHNAFEGKHSSVGERSMIGVFQQVAVQICDHQLGQLATFDLMFEGIRKALKSSVTSAITGAERQLDNQFAIRLLKALFLVKYVKEFKPTIRNISILMLEDFEQPLPQLRKDIETALNLLEQQTYIERNGEHYAYLTNVEKDVEEEIKKTDVDTSEVAAELERMVFDVVIKNRKIRYSENKQDYAYARKLDDRLFGRDHELGIHIISPFHPHAEDDATITALGVGKKNELLVRMPVEDRLMRDLLTLKKTEKYISQNISVTQQDAVKRILTDKSQQNRDRTAECEDLVRRLLSEAKLYVAGSAIESAPGDPQARILRGFHELIERAYPQLQMLSGLSYSENDIGTCLRFAEDGLFGSDATAMSEPEVELFGVIQSNHRGGLRTTLKALLEHFEKKPYGWYYAAILCTTANLCARGKIELRSDSNLLEDDAIERALRNTHGHGQIILEPQPDFSASQVRHLKELYEDLFDAPAAASEAKALGQATGNALIQLKNELTPLAAQVAQYPFLGCLDAVIETLDQVAGKPYSWYLTELVRMEDELIELKEEIVDPIRKFMSGPQKKIYDQARKFTRDQDANFHYLNEPRDGGDSEMQEVPSSEAEPVRPDQLTAILTDPECFKGNCIQQLDSLLQLVQKQVKTKVQAEVKIAQSMLTSLQSRLTGMDEFKALSAEQQAQLTQPFSSASSHLGRQTLIAVTRDSLRRFEENDYQRLLSQMANWANPAPTPGPTKNGEAPKAAPKSKPDRYVSIKKLQPSFDKAWLSSEQDVDAYVDAIKTELLKEIEKGHRIQI